MYFTKHNSCAKRNLFAFLNHASHSLTSSNRAIFPGEIPNFGTLFIPKTFCLVSPGWRKTINKITRWQTYPSSKGAVIISWSLSLIQGINKCHIFLLSHPIGLLGSSINYSLSDLHEFLILEPMFTVNQLPAQYKPNS